jgi:CRP-like cAMP-binding protein
MTPHGMLGAFRSHAFLKGLSERQLMVLGAGARPFTAQPGDYLAREGQTARAFYLIQSGHVELQTMAPGTETPEAPAGAWPELKPVTIQVVGPGEVVGWSWLVEPHRWRFDARAADVVQGLVLDGDWLREQCESDTNLGYQILKYLVQVLSERLTATRRRLIDHIPMSDDEPETTSAAEEIFGSTRCEEFFAEM